MVVDYELAWTRLQAHIAGKSQHGREGLLTEMATIAAESRVPEGERERWLRLFGVDVSRVARPLSTRDTRASSDGDEVAAGTDRDPSSIGQQGGHDGSSRREARREPAGV